MNFYWALWLNNELFFILYYCVNSTHINHTFSDSQFKFSHLYICRIKNYIYQVTCYVTKIKNLSMDIENWYFLVARVYSNKSCPNNIFQTLKK